MTSIPPILDEVEGYLRRLAADLTAPRQNECLCCYTARQLEEFSCDGTHRHALRYRDAMAPRATALKERLSQVGGCCCDCELFLNGYQLRTSAQQDAAGDADPVDDPEPEPLPPCAGVRRGSVRPCPNWVRIRRW